MEGGTRHTFWWYYKWTILKPHASFSALILDSRYLINAFYAVLITALLYTFVYVFLIFGGGQPFMPWLDIPVDVYYRYNVFFCAPTMFFGWILAAGVVHTVSRPVTNKGTFEQILCLFGFGIGIASWATGLHDILTSFLGAILVIDQRGYEVALNTPTVWRSLLWIQMSVYLLWFLVLFYNAVRTVYGLRPIASALLGTSGFIVYQMFFFIFNR